MTCDHLIFFFNTSIREDQGKGKVQTPGDAQTLVSGSDKVSVAGDGETDDSGTVYCEYIFVVPLPNMTGTRSTEGK